MKTETLSEIKSEARDRFSYILVFCPNFPKGTGATTKTAFEKLVNLIDAIMEHTKSEEAKQWLRVCLQEIRQSWKSYEDGNFIKGKDLIQQAREHFKKALSKKPIEARFVAGESGAAFDSEKELPE